MSRRAAEASETVALQKEEKKKEKRGKGEYDSSDPRRGRQRRPRGGRMLRGAAILLFEVDGEAGEQGRAEEDEVHQMECAQAVSYECRRRS
ncbi:hypothetical protein L596_019701 [Steinernema carpocapsae]|uniref:Uncharacterized protein n=1 Tax=Steinernema carpocapsae TaxID=34508 RepID=A0A4U5MRT6_STECR|nr:hypothetical protein L596_019701 [Steinernema carpocapsae]